MNGLKNLNLKLDRLAARDNYVTSLSAEDVTLFQSKGFVFATGLVLSNPLSRKVPGSVIGKAASNNHYGRYMTLDDKTFFVDLDGHYWVRAEIGEMLDADFLANYFPGGEGALPLPFHAGEQFDPNLLLLRLAETPALFGFNY